MIFQGEAQLPTVARIERLVDLSPRFRRHGSTSARSLQLKRVILLLTAVISTGFTAPASALFNQPAPPCASVTDFGAKGDGWTIDTSALQATLDSGAAEVCVPEGRYLTDALIVPERVGRISGKGELVQRTLGIGRAFEGKALYAGGLLNIVGVSQVTIDGLRFTGLSGPVPASSNSGVYVLSSSDVTVQGSTFTGWRWHAVFIQNSDHVMVQDNIVSGVAYGIRFTGVKEGTIARNVVRDPQVPPTTFTVAIGLDSTAGYKFGVCDHIVIADNLISRYVNAQAILIHAGTNISVVGNEMDDVLLGVSANPFLLADTLSDVTIAGNVYTGTSTPGAAPGLGNYGFFAGGGMGFPVKRIHIAGNVVRNANAVTKSYAQGGIGIGYAENVIVSNNMISGSYAAGIALNNPGTGLAISNNHINHILNVSDTPLVASTLSSAGLYISSGKQQGVATGNVIDDARWGVRVDHVADVSAFTVKCDNDFTNIAEKQKSGKIFYNMVTSCFA